MRITVYVDGCIPTRKRREKKTSKLLYVAVFENLEERVSAVRLSELLTEAKIPGTDSNILTLVGFVIFNYQ